MNKNTIIGVVAAVILLIVIIVWSNKAPKVDMVEEQGQEQTPNSNTSNNTPPDIATDGSIVPNVTPPGDSVSNIKAVVTEFGNRAKLVPITGGDFASQLEIQYGAYVNPQLLLQWKANPKLAFGKSEAKVWPDRIDIVSVNKVNDEKYKVQGSVIQVGPDSTKTVSTYPITLTVEVQKSAWVITAVSK